VTSNSLACRASGSGEAEPEAPSDMDKVLGRGKSASVVKVPVRPEPVGNSGVVSELELLDL
jgi:hypothetical protein